MKTKKILLIMGLFLIVSYIFVFADDQETNLLHRFNFTVDEDDNFGAINAANNGVSFSSAGGDFEDTESDNIDTNTQVLYDAGDFSYCVYVVPESFGTNYILSESATGNLGHAFRIRDESGDKHFNVFPTDVDTISSTTNLVAGSGYYACVRYTSGTGLIELFVNGTEEDSGTDSISDPNADLLFGKNYQASGIYFDGIMRDLCIWDSVITQDQIDEHMINGCVVAGGSPPAANSSYHTPVFPDNNFYFTSNLSTYSDQIFNTSGISFYFNGSNDYKYNIPDYSAYWRFENNVQDHNKNFNGTNNGGVYTSSGAVGGAYDFNGSGAYINISRHPWLNFTNEPITVSAWVKRKDNGSIQTIITNTDGTVTNNLGGYYLFFNSDQYVYFRFAANGGVPGDDDSVRSTIKPDNQWHMITGVYNTASYPSIFIDGINVTNQAGGFDGVGNYGSNKGYALHIGSTANQTNFLNGTIDELRIYNRSLSPQEISHLYNSTISKYNCYFYIDGSLNDSRLNISLNDSNTGNFSFTTSTIENHDFNITCTDYLKTESVQADNVTIDGLPRFNITFIGREFLTNASISVFNVTNGTVIETTATGSAVLKLKQGVHSIVGLSDNFYQGNMSINATASGSYNISFYKLLNITVLNVVNSSVITDYNLTFEGLDLPHNGSYLNYGGSSLLIPVINQSYNLTITKDGYAVNIGSQVVTIGDNESIKNFNFYLYTENSFNITFIDESTLKVINSTKIFLDLISTPLAANYSTETGHLYIDLLTPTTYTLRYYGQGFQPRLSSKTLTDQTYQEITLYLLQGGENVTIYVYDQNTDAVEGATIQIYRYSTTSNSYILVNTINTDFEGKSIVNLEMNSEFYKFFIYYNGELKKQTQGAYITGTELTFEINLDEALSQNYFNVQSVDGYVSFNEQTDNFRFYFNDPVGSVSQGCLKIYTVTNAGSSLYSSSCTAGSSALILGAAANVSGLKYTANGYIYISGQEIFFDTYSYTFKAESIYQNYGLVFVIFMTILFGMVVLWDPAVGLVLMGLPTLIGSFQSIGWINLPLPYAVGVEIILIVLAAIMKKRPF